MPFRPTLRWSLAAVAVVAAALAVATLASAPAHAQTTTDCQAKIESLREATATATFVGQNAEKERAGLQGKLDSASAKLREGKFEDALQALTQFRDKVATLQAQGKIAPEDANTLIGLANDAIACVQDLSAGV